MTPGHPERRYLNPAESDARDRRRGKRHAESDEENVRPVDRKFPGAKWLSDKGDVNQCGFNQEKESEPQSDTHKRRGDRFYGGDHGNLAQRRSRQAHRGEALFATGR